MTVVGFPTYPEISKEKGRLFPSNESKELIFEDDFFKESKIIKKP